MIPSSYGINAKLIAFFKDYLNDFDQLERATYALKLIAFLKSICKSEQQAQAFFYFLEHEAATVWTLQVDLQLPEATAYRIIKSLLRAGFIEKAIKIPKVRGSRGGPRPTVYALIGGDPKKVPDAILKHSRAISPRYRVAEEIAQKLIDTWLIPKRRTEYAYRELIVDVREATQLRGQPLIDVTNMTAQALMKNNIKVWR